MSLEGLLQDLFARGVELWFEGDRLRFRAPAGVMTPELRAQVGAQRAELLGRLRRDAAARVDTHPLSFSQRSLWFIHQQHPTSAAYHVSMSVRIHSTVQVPRLRESVQALVDRHAVLRTTYRLADDGPCQSVAGAVTAAFEYHACEDLSEVELRDRIEADYRRPFDLSTGPVLRASLYSRGPEQHVLLLAVHHIAADGWSLLLMFRELTALYDEFSAQIPARLSRPSVSYVDYAAWQQQLLDGPEGHRLWEYWRGQLAAPRAALSLPTDYARKDDGLIRGASLAFELLPPLVERINALARQEGTTPFALLLTCFHAFLYRLTGREDIVVGTPTFARSKAEFVDVVGDFVNPVAMRARFEPGMTRRALLGSLRDALHGALDAQEFPLPLLVERLQPDRASGRTPLFDTFFILQRFERVRDVEELLIGAESDRLVQCGTLKFGVYPLEQQQGQFDLSLEMAQRDRVLHAAFKYNTQLFEPATIAAWTADFTHLVTAFTADLDGSLATLPAPKRPGEDAAAVNELLDRLATHDIRLWLEEGRLRVSAPKNALDDTLKNEIALRKPALIQVLERREQAARLVVDEPGRMTALPRGGPLPVSSAQQRLWFLDRLDPGRSTYNIGIGMRFRGPLRADALARALTVLVERQESLRTRIVEANGRPVAELLPTGPLPFETVDISHLSQEECTREEQRLQTHCLRRPFDLASGPPCRFVLLRSSSDDHLLCVTMHQAVADDWSLMIAAEEICRLYEATVTGEAPRLPALSLQYADFAGWEQEQLHSGRMAEHFAYWRERLKGAPALLELPLDRPRPAVQSMRGMRVERYLDSTLLAALRELSRQCDVTLFMTMLAAWQVLLHRLSGSTDILVGTPVANRSQPELQSLVGSLDNNIVLRADMADDPTFADFLATVKRTTLDAFKHAGLPFDVVVDGVNPQRSASHAPVFQVLFNLLSQATTPRPPPGLATEIVHSDTAASRFDLAIELVELDGRMRVAYEFSTDLFDEATIERWHRHFDVLLTAVATDHATRVSGLPLLNSAEQRLLVQQWNGASCEWHSEICVHQLFESTARGRPDAVAVIDAQGASTYAAVEQRANRLAHLLRARGLQAGGLAAVCLDRSADMVVALLAVLKCGAAYVPLDPTHPTDRLRYTIGDAGASCVLTQQRHAGLFGDDSHILMIDTMAAELAAQPATPLGHTIQPGDLAYVIYTSGSTGKPKGVEVEHRNLASFLDAMRLEPGLGPADALLAVTTLSFDIAGLELWLPLAVGARLVIASRADALDAERLAELIDSHGITTLQATPATWRLLIEAGWAGCRRLKALCGGEAMPSDLVAPLLERVGELWNMYGPSETTVWSTLYRVTRLASPIPIGRPIPNTRVYVLEPAGMPAPVGVAGELCIAGAGVARGYRDRPELTAEKFVTITLPDDRGERVYRTGDTARWRGDGQLEFLGRSDTQVKVRGYRIELGEIEAVLARHPGVRQCVVTVRQDVAGDQRLVGYVVTEGQLAFDADAARETLRQQLPEYMIPKLFMPLTGLPLTANGKIDRKLLPQPQVVDATALAATEREHEILMTAPQQRVAGIWRGLLQSSRVGLYDNFFDLGGHSLLLVRLQAALRREFDRDIALVELFQRTTVAAQAEWLSAPAAASSALRRAQARVARQSASVT